MRGRAAIAGLFRQGRGRGNAIAYKGRGHPVRRCRGAHQLRWLDPDAHPGRWPDIRHRGAAPPSTAGVITQGAGDIQLYSLDSILLGQSRIMTTFGGSIMGWSAAGDINAGRGSKTTVVYTPPRRVYDNWGNVSLSPSVPSTWCGDRHAKPDPGSAGRGYRPDCACWVPLTPKRGFVCRAISNIAAPRGQRGEYPDPG